VAVGLEDVPDVHEVDPEFMSGSLVDWVVDGHGPGVTIILVGDKVVPPVTVVLDPNVSVPGGSSAVFCPQTKIPPVSVDVAVGLRMIVVPLRTLVN
jgi:hypothetical protein